MSRPCNCADPENCEIPLPGCRAQAGMNIDEQVRIMELQMSNFDTLLEKLSWLSMAFDPDPAYSKRARNIVRGNLSRELELAERALQEQE